MDDMQIHGQSISGRILSYTNAWTPITVVHQYPSWIIDFSFFPHNTKNFSGECINAKSYYTPDGWTGIRALSSAMWKSWVNIFRLFILSSGILRGFLCGINALYIRTFCNIKESVIFQGSTYAHERVCPMSTEACNTVATFDNDEMEGVFTTIMQWIC